MASDTVTIGDTEVEVRETDDGFEVTEVDDGGLFIRVVSSSGHYGFEIPITADFYAEHRGGNCYDFAWHSEDDVSHLESRGNRPQEISPEDEGYDSWCGASGEFEIIDRR
jgi:hypothetical protein